MRPQTTLIAAVLALAASSGAGADVAEDARALLDSGEWEEALSMAEGELTARPKSNSAGVLNAIAGEALYLLGRSPEAETYLEKARARGVADAYLLGGRMAMERYDFPGAAKMYERYVALREKASKPVEEEAESGARAASLASDMLERVENITVIDRIDVEHDDFFRRYRLSPESGSLRAVAEVAADYPGVAYLEEAQSPVFQNERGDFRLWSQPDGEGQLEIVESNRYIDGDWEPPVEADRQLGGGGNAAFPFMMADGATLYFASDGEGSIGGYDIFRSNRDSSTGRYMAPSNMGMPYNSPYNDFMLAIDESNGIGWWATDRNQLADGQISIYVFIPNEVRRNHDAENPDIVSLASLSDPAVAQPESEMERIESLRGLIGEMGSRPGTDEGGERVDFRFPVASGRVYRRMEDFHSARAAALMEQWLEETESLEGKQRELSELRRRYPASPGDPALRSRILSLENSVEKESSALRRLRGKIIAEETKVSPLH